MWSYVAKLFGLVFTNLVEKYIVRFYNLAMSWVKLRDMEKDLKKKSDEVSETVSSAKEEIKTTGEISDETKKSLIEKTRNVVRGSFKSK